MRGDHAVQSIHWRASRLTHYTRQVSSLTPLTGGFTTPRECHQKKKLGWEKQNREKNHNQTSLEKGAGLTAAARIVRSCAKIWFGVTAQPRNNNTGGRGGTRRRPRRPHFENEGAPRQQEKIYDLQTSHGQHYVGTRLEGVPHAHDMRIKKDALRESTAPPPLPPPCADTKISQRAPKRLVLWTGHVSKTNQNTTQQT